MVWKVIDGYSTFTKEMAIADYRVSENPDGGKNPGWPVREHQRSASQGGLVVRAVSAATFEAQAPVFNGRCECLPVAGW